MDQKKELRVRWRADYIALIQEAAQDIGLSATAYAKLALLERLARDGYKAPAK